MKILVVQNLNKNIHAKLLQLNGHFMLNFFIIFLEYILCLITPSRFSNPISDLHTSVTSLTMSFDMLVMERM